MGRSRLSEEHDDIPRLDADERTVQDAFDIVPFRTHEMAGLAQLQRPFVGCRARRTAPDEMGHGSKLSTVDICGDTIASVDGLLNRAREVHQPVLPNWPAEGCSDLRDAQHRRGVARGVHRRLLLRHGAHHPLPLNRRSFAGYCYPAVRLVRKAFERLAAEALAAAVTEQDQPVVLT